jgi:hypothetical protein
VDKEAKHNPFINGNRDNYISAQYKAVRNAWQGEMDALINEIYVANKPKTHKIMLEMVAATQQKKIADR